MTPKLKFLSLFTLLLVFQNSYSADFQFSEPVLSGSGCPIGTARASLSPDGSALTLLFDQFLVN